jgi:hypothetical protein
MLSQCLHCLKRKFFRWRLWKSLIHHTYINPQTNWILISIYYLQYPSSCGWNFPRLSEHIKSTCLTPIDAITFFIHCIRINPFKLMKPFTWLYNTQYSSDNIIVDHGKSIIKKEKKMSYFWKKKTILSMSKVTLGYDSCL